MRKLTPITMNAMSESFYDKAFRGVSIPARLKAVAVRICDTYGIRGDADPLYICNVVAYEMAVGDGEGLFWEEAGRRWRVDRIGNAWCVVDTATNGVVSRHEVTAEFSVRQAMQAAMAEAMRLDDVWITTWLARLAAERGAVGVGRDHIFASRGDGR